MEVVATRAAFALVGRLPRPAVLFLAHALGTLGYLVSPGLRRIGRANLDLAFGASIPIREKKRILRRSFQAFALTTLDVFWFARDMKERVRRFVRFERPLAEVLGGGRRICLTGHFGNWEILGQAVVLSGYPLTSVAMPLKNPAVDERFNRFRQAAGQAIVPRQGAVRALIRTLRAGGNVALLLDQNTPPSEGGVFVDFFGRPVAVSAAGAVLASRTGAPVAFGFALPERQGYLVRLPPGLPPTRPGTPENEVQQWTQRITRLYEDEIRRRPECWVWTYKRWKYIRPGDDPQHYPFYATRS